MRKNGIIVLVINLICSMLFCSFSYADTVCQKSNEQETSPSIYFSEIGDNIMVNENDNNIVIDFSNLKDRQEKLVNKFKDVDSNSCFSFSIEYLRQCGILDNESDFFYPMNNMTVSEFELWLSRIDKNCSIKEFHDSLNIKQDLIQSEDVLTCDNIVLLLYNDAIMSNKSIINGKHDATGKIVDIVNDNSIDLSEKAKEVLLLSGIVSYEKPNEYKTGKILKRQEAANYLSRYIMYDKKPELIIGDDSCRYIEEDFTFDKDKDEYIETGNSAKWTNTVHEKITSWGFQILFNDKSSTISNLTGKYSSTARNYVIDGVNDPDYIENDGNTFLGHYCSPQLTTKNGAGSPSAYIRFNNHYYNARCEYYNANYSMAYIELGRAMHYMEDITSPPHSALIPGTPHSNYESYASSNVVSNSRVYSAPSNTYSYMSGTSFCDISANFATYSEGYRNIIYDDNSSSTKYNGTKYCLQKAQRGVAGLAYRFLGDTNRL